MNEPGRSWPRRDLLVLAVSSTVILLLLLVALCVGGGKPAGPAHLTRRAPMPAATSTTSPR